MNLSENIKKILPAGVVHILWFAKTIPVYFAKNIYTFFCPETTEKNILGVWDLKAVPWSIGDLLIFMQNLGIMKIRYNCKKIDLVIMVDSENPGGNRDDFAVSKNGFHGKLFQLLEVAATSPYLGSVFTFDNRKDGFHFLRENADKYNMYPELIKVLSETFNLIGSADLQHERDFFKEFGYLPKLHAGEPDICWALGLYDKTLGKKQIPIALTMRNNPGSKCRNIASEPWLGFLRKAEAERPDIKFYLLGTRDEYLSELDELSNVVSTKKFGSTLSEDFAIINTCAMFIGMDSGVMFMAVYDDIPYVTFGTEERAGKKIGLNPEGNLIFANKWQRMLTKSFKITSESLFAEFEKTCEGTNTEIWEKRKSQVLEKLKGGN